MLTWEQFAAKKKRDREPSPKLASGGHSEVTVVHSQLLRMALAVEESRIYWERLEPSVPFPKRAKLAFEQRWFEAKSLERVRCLINSFVLRYDAFPTALTVLSRWSGMDLATRQVICHWHLQLSDPVYRRFTSDLLLRRRALRDAKVDRDTVLCWLKAEFPDRWSEDICVQFAGKLLSAAREAGLVSRHDPRTLSFPRVTDHALAYLLYLLRDLQFHGTLTNNPYLQSVGLSEELLGQRPQGLPGVTMHKLPSLIEFEWGHANLVSWVKEVTRNGPVAVLGDP